MKIEFRIHYWPNTPNLREVKLFVDNEIICSYFLNANQLHQLALDLLRHHKDMDKLCYQLLRNENDHTPQN